MVLILLGSEDEMNFILFGTVVLASGITKNN